MKTISIFISESSTKAKSRKKAPPKPKGVKFINKRQKAIDRKAEIAAFKIKKRKLEAEIAMQEANEKANEE